MRAALAAILLVHASAAAAAPPAGGGDRFPEAAASYLVEVQGRRVWARAPDEPRLPASLTKIMTALLALEGPWRPGDWVVVSPKAARETGTRLGLTAGDAMRGWDLLAATVIASANDACMALAEHVAGSEAAFVARMNRRAAELGLTATHFDNPCGHDAPGQRASAADLARLAREALRFRPFRELAARPEVTLVTRDGRVVGGRSGNHLLGDLDGASGVKSGFTPGAGKCLVALVERRGVEVLLVLLDAEGYGRMAEEMIEAAIERAGARAGRAVPDGIRMD